MGRKINGTKLNKQYILDNVSQISIFSAYLNIKPSIIQYCIDTGKLIVSPLRNDKHPTCGFQYNNAGKLKFRDFAGFFWGDCFDIVAYILSEIDKVKYDISIKNDFIKVLRHITFTFKDVFYGSSKDINLISEINTAIDSIKVRKPKIEVIIRPINEQDISYWGQFNIDSKNLNDNFIYCVDKYYINREVNPEAKYYYDFEDPCYAYLLGKDRSGKYNIKLYFPYRRKSNVRFITNCNHLEGIYNLSDDYYDYIVITKSTKDRTSIRSTIDKCISLYGQDTKSKLCNYKDIKIGVIAIPHETYKLRELEYQWLLGKVTDCTRILSLMDRDITGIREAIYLRNNFNIDALLIPKKYKAKDFTDFVKNRKLIEVNKVINNTINYIENERKFVPIKQVEKGDALPY